MPAMPAKQSIAMMHRIFATHSIVIYWLGMLLTIAPLAAQAQVVENGSSIIFAQASLRILPTAVDAAPAASASVAPESAASPTKDETTRPGARAPELNAKPSLAKPALAAPSARQPVQLSIEIRPLSALDNPDVLLLSPPAHNRALLIALDAPRPVTLERANIFTPLDVAFIDENGVIVQIAPEITLAELPAPVQSPKMIRALLLLGKKQAKTLDIRPGDTAQHGLFTPVTAIVQ